MTIQAASAPVLIQPYDLAGPNVLLMGPAGTGKTFSLGTLADAGIEVCYLGLEPGLEALKGYWTDRGLPIPDNVRWHQVAAPGVTFQEMIGNAQKINTLNLDTLSKFQDPNRSKHNFFIKILEALNGYTDQRTGEELGPVDKWPTNRAIAVDGLTGLGRATMSLVVGGKPVRSQPDWGIAQDQLESILRMLCDQCRCWFVLLAHVERETDLVLGGIKISVSTLGRALPPKIPPMFSDVILTVRVASKWTWDVASAAADTKTRNLPISANLEPDFGQIVRKWEARAKAE